MNRIETEILIVGAGIAGLAATAAFAAAGFEVICLDPELPATRPDQRSTAFLMPAVALLQRAGVWQRLQKHAAPIRMMRLVDADPLTHAIGEKADFDCREINQDQFGFNLPNAFLRQEFTRHLEQIPSVRIEAPAALDHLTARSDCVLTRLTDGRVISTRLLVAADGRHSSVRTILGIKSRTWRYGQRAIVFTVRHAVPHDNISTEIHQSGGPFTLVPSGDTHRSAVVWMEDSAKVSGLMALSDQDFAAAAGLRSCNVLGPLTLTSPRAAWPIIAQLANRFDGPRSVLIAEAAHVVPPIGAQGLNMSLSDIALLLDLAIEARKKALDIGSANLLSRYNARRHPVIAARITAIDALNRAAQVSSPTLRNLRRSGLHALFTIEPLRKTAMRLGLG